MTDKSKLLDQVIGIALEAGTAIMEIYGQNDVGVETKVDSTDFESPLTKADLASNKIIEEGLAKVSQESVLSEEGAQDVSPASNFWLIDPLDGTKEFIKRNGEFTVNIALIENEVPVLGVVFAPAKGLLYAAADGEAYKIVDGKKVAIKSEYKGDIPTVVASRRHRDEKLDEYIAKLGEHKEVNMGSSLKLCLVAEGVASHYPRLWPTFTWDTGAADAVVRAAGGSVTNLQGQALAYPPKAQRNPFFVAKVANAASLES